MSLIGAIIGAIGAALVLVEALERWRNTNTLVDGGNPSTDWAAIERKARFHALASAVGPALVLVGAVLTILAL